MKQTPTILMAPDWREYNPYLKLLVTSLTQLGYQHGLLVFIKFSSTSLLKDVLIYDSGPDSGVSKRLLARSR